MISAKCRWGPQPDFSRALISTPLVRPPLPDSSPPRDDRQRVLDFLFLHLVLEIALSGGCYLTGEVRKLMFGDAREFMEEARLEVALGRQVCSTHTCSLPTAVSPRGDTGFRLAC